MPGIELHCCGASGPKINYFFNVEIILERTAVPRAAGEASDFARATSYWAAVQCAIVCAQ